MQGFAGYKVGMTHVIMVDDHKSSPTEGRDVMVPVTVLAAAIVAALFLALFIGAVLTVRTRLRNAPPLLAASLEELRRDAAALMPPERRGP